MDQPRGCIGTFERRVTVISGVREFRPMNLALLGMSGAEESARALSRMVDVTTVGCDIN
jgi:hypothetical protein